MFGDVEFVDFEIVNVAVRPIVVIEVLLAEAESVGYWAKAVSKVP